MAVGKISFPSMPSIEGVTLNAVSAGIKKRASLDLVLISLPETAVTAGVFTQNAFCAAPVTLCKSHLKQTANTRYLLINSGNANACTGEQGMNTALQSCYAVSTQAQLNRAEANSAQVNSNQVLPFSTGVIGENLDVSKIENALPQLFEGLSESHWSLAAQGIMTTDTLPKGANISLRVGDENLIVNGIAKGAGMIKPNMATMLAYIVTNACISKELLQELLNEAADLSFNRITIDGDTSTNDSCMLVAAGTSSIVVNDKQSPHYAAIKKAITDVLVQLAQLIVRDGEGATKFVTVRVQGGQNNNECLQVAYAIAHSPLIKTALYASDPNWGRIIAAIGYAGLSDLDVSHIRVFLNELLIVENGGRASSYSEEQGKEVMTQEEIILRVDLGRGDASETIWTTDLSHDYIKINAEYRT